MNKWIATLAIGAAALSVNASYVGENSLRVSASHVELSIPGQNPDGWSSTATLNYNIHKTEAFGIDLAGNLGYGEISLGAQHLDSKAVGVSAVFFLDKGNFKPFVSLDLSHVWADGRDGVLRFEADSFVYGATAGVEFNPTDVLTLLVWGGYARDEDTNDDSWVGAVDAIYWIQQNHGLGLGFSLTEDSESIRASYTFKF